jgi:hypothetical protein
MTKAIRGISRSSLWRSWKAVRSELKKCALRDVVDYLEYDINPEKWINHLLDEIARGTYEPRQPQRFTEAKSNGFSRRMTQPAIPDLVLFRTIADSLYRRAKRYERGQVFCERDELPQPAPDTERPKDPFIRALEDWLTDYHSASGKAFRTWLKYNQYRKRLVFRRVHKFIVITDIANFFDSILYSRLTDSFSRLSVPPRMLGLLFFMLERLSIRDAYTESPRIGLPVDEFACSRKLAHMVLFPHDDRMIEYIGEDSYVRWMDDQTFGVASKADGLRCLAAVGESLSRLHLTPNAKKSHVLSIAAAKRYFHFDLNEALDRVENLLKEKPLPLNAIRREIRAIYGKARKVEGQGQSDKVLKRIYRIAAIAGLRGLRRRALRDIVNTPTMARRILDYIRATGSVTEHLEFVREVWKHPEQVYPDVNAIAFESLLRAEAQGQEARHIATLASAMLRGAAAPIGHERCSPIAPLLLLRFGDRRNLPLLRTVFVAGTSPATRAAAVIYAGFGRREANEVETAAAAHLRSQLPRMVLMLRALRGYSTVPRRWGLRCSPAFDGVTGRRYLDMRGLAAIRLLGLNYNAPVRQWLMDKRTQLEKSSLSAFDRSLLARLWPSAAPIVISQTESARKARAKRSAARTKV